MTTKTELEKVLEEILLETAHFYLNNSPKADYNPDQDLKEILALIEQECLRARVDELEHRICHKHGPSKSCPQIYERLEQLNSNKESDSELLET